MKHLALIDFSNVCRDALLLDGFTVDVEVPNLEIEEEAKAIGKGFVTPTLSSHYSDFTVTNAFWLTMRREGRLVAIMGMRYDDLGDEPISRYLGRAYKRQYGADVSEHPSLVDASLGGRLVYMGDLFFDPEIRGNQSRLMCYVHFAHCLCFMNWKETQSIYAFHRRQDVLRGKTDQYGFGQRIPGPMVWNDGPDYRSSTEYLAILTRDDFKQRMDLYLQFPELITG